MLLSFFPATGSNRYLPSPLQIQMFVGGLIGFVLDNTVPGATRAQRGLSPTMGKSAEEATKAYRMPQWVRRGLKRFPALSKLPFFPSV